MSRAFVKENDDAVEDLPERPISSAPNLVTAEGLAQIESEIAKLNTELNEAREDRALRARIGRDLRYWTLRRGSAQLTPAPADDSIVRFGACITIIRSDGREAMYRIVGEDEANPEQGSISHVSPLARALLGRAEGDVVRVNADEIELVSIR